MTALSDRPHSPSAIIRRLECFRSVISQIERGLRGEQFVWDGAEGEYNTLWAEAMGLHLVTATWIKKHGYRLKRAANPVGWRYFRAPISKRRPVYVLECQAVKLPEKEPS